MEDLLKSSNVQNIFTQLGTFVGDEYVPSDDCYPILLHIYEKLNTEDANSRNFRQIIGFSQLVKKDLIPMLVTVKNDKILDILIKVLANIMTPIECLMPVSGRFVEEDIGCTVTFKLNWLLSTSKIACANVKAIKRITQIIKENCIKLSSCQGGSRNCSAISDCLQLIKNILHVPNDQYQNHILRMLSSENFDEILNDLILNANREQWAVIIIELIALIFKNQHVDQMSKLLIKMNETMISDSSEDNESNTSPYPNNGISSSPENLSESSNSDDDDTDQRLKVFQSQFKEEMCHLNSTDKQDKKTLCVLEENVNEKSVDDKLKTKCVFKEPSSLRVMDSLKRRDSKEQIELKKSRLERRRNSIEQLKNKIENQLHKTTTLNPAICNRKSKLRMKKNTKTKLNFQVLPMHMSSHVCISHFLQKFTVRFMRNGFNTLVDDIYNLLTSNSHQYIDTSLYFWILTYFCRFCKLNGIELKSVRRIVSFRLISYIVHEGFNVSEQLMIAKRQQSHNIHLQVRHLHLVVLAIKEVIKLIEFYRQSAVESPLYVELINHLKYSDNSSPESTTWAKGLKSIFALLIRQYDSNIQVIEYLYDLIVTNHMVLSLFDNIKDCWNLHDSIIEHIKKFAAPDIMFNYGTVLQNYKKNDEIVNEAVFTMMHHIIGEVEDTTVLFQPIILKIFLKVFEEKDNLYERWSDLIEYVINKFLNLSQTEFCPMNMSSESRRASKC